MSLKQKETNPTCWVDLIKTLTMSYILPSLSPQCSCCSEYTQPSNHNKSLSTCALFPFSTIFYRSSASCKRQWKVSNCPSFPDLGKKEEKSDQNNCIIFGHLLLVRCVLWFYLCLKTPPGLEWKCLILIFYLWYLQGQMFWYPICQCKYMTHVLSSQI